MKKLLTTSLLPILFAAPALAQAPAAPPVAAAKPINMGDLRHHIYVMEGALARAVDYGAKQLNREILAAMPGVFMLEGEARARGAGGAELLLSSDMELSIDGGGGEMKRVTSSPLSIVKSDWASERRSGRSVTSDPASVGSCFRHSAATEWLCGDAFGGSCGCSSATVPDISFITARLRSESRHTKCSR